MADTATPWRVLGEVLVLTGSVRRGWGSHPEPLGELTRQALQALGDPPSSGWERAFHQTPEGFALWEPSTAPPESDPRRLLCVLVPSGREQALDNWTWSDGTARLMPFARYLLHAAKVGYQARVYARMPRPEQVAVQVERGLYELDDLVARITDPESTGTVSIRELVWAQTVTRLRELRQTVAIAQDNLRPFAPEAMRRGSDHTLFERDRALGDWLREQISNDLVYLEALRDRSQQLLAAADDHVREMIQEHREAERRHNDWLGLLQTALVGGLIMALTAVQALGFVAPLRPSLRAPTVLGLAALAVVVPLAIFRGSLPRSGRRAGVVAVAALGASASWLVTGAVWRAARHVALPVIPTLLALAAGAAIVAVLAWGLSRSDRRRPRRVPAEPASGDARA